VVRKPLRAPREIRFIKSSDLSRRVKIVVIILSCPRITGQGLVLRGGPRLCSRQARRFASPRCARLACKIGVHWQPELALRRGHRRCLSGDFYRPGSGDQFGIPRIIYAIIQCAIGYGRRADRQRAQRPDLVNPSSRHFPKAPAFGRPADLGSSGLALARRPRCHRPMLAQTTSWRN
jgi:hypothetical protein